MLSSLKRYIHIVSHLKKIPEHLIVKSISDIGGLFKPYSVQNNTFVLQIIKTI